MKNKKGLIENSLLLEVKTEVSKTYRIIF